MKKLLFFVAIVAVVSLTACTKSHKCRCTTTDLETPVVTDVAMQKANGCSGIVKLGVENVREGKFVREVHPVSCEEVKE